MCMCVVDRFEVEPGVEKGENWSGVLYKVTVSSEAGAKEAGAKEAMRLVFKSVPQSAMHRAAMKSHATFHNEAHMYTAVLPALLRLLQSKAVLGPDAELYPGTVRSAEFEL